MRSIFLSEPITDDLTSGHKAFTQECLLESQYYDENQHERMLYWDI